MAFQLEFKPKTVKDLDKLPSDIAGRVIQKLESLRSGLKGGDVKRLTNFSPEYRLRVGDYRALLRWKEPALSCIESSIAGKPTANVMIKLKPEILHQNGKPQFAVIPYADFLAIQEELEDAACLRILRKAKASQGKSANVSLNDVKERLGLGTSRIRRTSRAVA